MSESPIRDVSDTAFMVAAWRAAETARPARRDLFADSAAGSRRALVLTEGVIRYLAVEEVASLADDLRGEDAIRSWIVDCFSAETLRYRRRHARHMRNAPFRFTPRDWFGLFAAHGWRAREVRYIAEEAERLRRPIPLPRRLRLLLKLRHALASPARRGAMRRFAGYALLEPA